MAQNHASDGRLSERVYSQLLGVIVDRNLVQGDRLPSERELCELTKVSRPVVREALMRLHADGVIESRRGSGSFLRHDPPPPQLQHLRPAAVRMRLQAFEARIALEPAVARSAALLRSEQDLQAIRAALVASEHIDGPGLHRAIAEASRNPMFLVVLDAIERADRTAVSAPEATAEAACGQDLHISTEHAAIVEAIGQGDPDGAEAAMRYHLLSARARCLRGQGAPT